MGGLKGRPVVDLAGQRFGALLVTGQDPHYRTRRSICTCLCDCGAVRHIPANYLTRGTATNCGDRRKHRVPGRGPVDITGQRFGALVVTGLSHSGRDGQTLWVCACDCGAVRTVRRSNLMRGNTTSCGDRASHPVDYAPRLAADGTVPDTDAGAAASFETIAAVLGVSRQRVRGIYEIALRKIRNNPEILRQLEGHR